MSTDRVPIRQIDRTKYLRGQIVLTKADKEYGLNILRCRFGTDIDLIQQELLRSIYLSEATANNFIEYLKLQPE